MGATNLLGTEIPYVEAAHQGGHQRPSAVVLRTSWTTGDKGAALGIANAWHNPYNRIDSCHYVVDEATTYRCIPDDVMANYSVPNYKGAVSINVCYDPPELPNEQTLERAAKLTARLCKRYHLPLRILSTEEELRWIDHSWRRRSGIILKTAWKFPADEFFAYVVFEHRSL